MPHETFYIEVTQFHVEHSERVDHLVSVCPSGCVRFFLECMLAEVLSKSFRPSRQMMNRLLLRPKPCCCLRSYFAVHIAEATEKAAFKFALCCCLRSEATNTSKALRMSPGCCVDVVGAAVQNTIC